MDTIDILTKCRSRWNYMAKSRKFGKITVDLHQHTLPDTHQGYGPSRRVTSPPVRVMSPSASSPAVPMKLKVQPREQAEAGGVPDVYGVSGRE